MDGLQIKIQIEGGPELLGELPLIPTRFLVSEAFFRSMGWTPGDEERPSGEGDVDDLAGVYAACLGLCWPGEPAWPTLRSLKRDLVGYGEHVAHHLLLEGYTHAAILVEGGRLCKEIRSSIPTASEVQQVARDFTGAPEEASSTGSTAGSG